MVGKGITFADPVFVFPWFAWLFDPDLKRVLGPPLQYLVNGAVHIFFIELAGV